jgi:hypothetical protein
VTPGASQRDVAAHFCILSSYERKLRVTFAIRYHQALRFYPDAKAGYEYPALYKRFFGEDYVPAPHVKAAYEYARRHKWYDAPREVTVSDLYASIRRRWSRSTRSATSSAATSGSRRMGSASTAARLRTCGAPSPTPTRRCEVTPQTAPREQRR